ncbi:MAG: ribosome biogenesis/translation initiation ATPase RLI, partial [Methanomicrobiales archaeon HGW-Methanomicrobiales-4]
ETISIDENKKAFVSEELCVGCGICVKKCPFEAIDIITLPEELEYPTHRYGPNSFVLYGMPAPVQGKVTGVLGANGIGKSTSVKILSGQLTPNLGIFEEQVQWDSILKKYAGTELFDYLQLLSKGGVKVSVKPQAIDIIPKVFTGVVRDLLKTTDERGVLSRYIEQLSLTTILDQEIKFLSGGELQRVALTAALAREADFYFLDEITPFLDIHQRMAAADVIRELAELKPIILIEHDIAILDMLADTVHIAYGKPAVFGIITQPKGVRVGINQYLEGFLVEENVRIRDYPVTFEINVHDKEVKKHHLMSIPVMSKKFDRFSLQINGGEIRAGEVIGVVGANGIGKTTFAQLLAGAEKPDTGEITETVRVSYKPQYIKAESSDSVEFTLRQITTSFDSSRYQHDIIEPLSLSTILQSPLNTLSGGELQRVSIAVCLSRDADLYILDEPSAHLDVEQRMKLTKIFRQQVDGKETAVLIIDHDIYLVDFISERLLVFEGTPGVEGRAT